MFRWPRPVRVILPIIVLGLAAAGCSGGEDDPPIAVASSEDAPALPTRTGVPGASATPGRMATPRPFSATCGFGGEVAAKHTAEGRLRSPRQPAAPSLPASAISRVDPGLQETIRRSLGSRAGSFGVAVVDVDGRYAEVSGDRTFYAASLYKLAVLFEVYRQRELGLLSFDERLLYTPHYAQYDLNGAPIPVCGGMTVGQAVRWMITISDNVSAVILQDRVGAAAINTSMTSIGVTRTKLAADGVWTTARDMARLMELIALGRAVSGPASAEMRSLLLQQSVRNRIPAAMPPGVVVGNKTGDWQDYAHDTAFVVAPSGTYTIAVLSKGGRASEIARLSADVHAYLETGTMPPEPSPTATPSSSPTAPVATPSQTPPATRP